VDYDDQNIFAKILRGEIPCDKVYENDQALAFWDIQPQAPVHVLVIPKGPYLSYVEFAQTASETELTGFMRAVGAVAKQLGVAEAGSRILSNQGKDGLQEVPHFHLHMFAGKSLGWMIRPVDK
jgi:histidine triad (HIT) family protein